MKRGGWGTTIEVSNTYLSIGWEEGGGRGRFFFLSFVVLSVGKWFVVEMCMCVVAGDLAQRES